MKVGFFQRLNTRLSLFPMFIMLIVFIAGGIGFYIFGYSHFLKDFHKLHLINLSSNKKLIMDSWLQYYKTDLQDLSRLGIFRDSAAILMKDTQKLQKGRKAREAFNEAQLNISRLFEEKTSSKKYNALCLLSMDGRVVFSSLNDLVGADWSDRAFFKKMAPEMKSTSAVGFSADAGSDNSMEFITSVFDMHENMIALLYASLKVDDLTGFLKIKNGLYKSEKIELIDRDGNIVLTEDGYPTKKIKYNIPNNNSQNIVQYKDGIFFYVADLEQAPLRLIAMVKKSEAARPFTILLIMYLSFAGVVILLFVIQNAYLAKRLITKPVSKLINAVKSVAAGDLSVDIGKDYKGELFELKKAFESMVEGLREWESNLRENIRTKEQAAIRSTIADISWLEDEKFVITKNAFNMWDLLKEIEGNVRNMIESKEIELIVDCDDAFLNKPVYTDRLRFGKLLSIVVMNAIKSSEVGTITVLCSYEIKNGEEYIEVSIADTGQGIEPEMMESIFEEFANYPTSFIMSIAKKLASALGGSIDFESTYGKGSVFTVTIPIKAIV